MCSHMRGKTHKQTEREKFCLFNAIPTFLLKEKGLLTVQHVSWVNKVDEAAIHPSLCSPAFNTLIVSSFAPEVTYPSRDKYRLVRRRTHVHAGKISREINVSVTHLLVLIGALVRGQLDHKNPGALWSTDNTPGHKARFLPSKPQTKACVEMGEGRETRRVGASVLVIKTHQRLENLARPFSCRRSAGLVGTGLKRKRDCRPGLDDGLSLLQDARVSGLAPPRTRLGSTGDSIA